MYIHVYECKVMYVHCTYTFMIVYMCMHSTDTSQAVQLHNHTSLLIRPDQPCDAGESQLSAGSFPSELPPSESVISLLLEQLSDWLNPVCTMYIHCIYTFIRCI